MSVFRSQQADYDIEEIALYIAQENPNAALRWLDDIEKKLQVLGDMPNIGSPRNDVKLDLRTWVFGNYLILYQQNKSETEILRVLHGARQWEDLV